MKIFALFAIFLFLLPVGYAKSKTVILDRGDSLVMEGINITLMDYNKKKDKVLVCVDNSRYIIKDERRAGRVYFEIRSFRDDGVKIILDADCDDCTVSDNSGCYAARNIDENITEEDVEIESDETAGIEEGIIDKEEVEEKEEVERGKTGEAKSSYSGIFKRIVLAVLDWFR